MKKIKLIVLCVILMFFVSGVCQADEILDRVRSEADYILSCQYLGSSGYGAINNVSGFPTWVVPRENAMAILGLILSADRLNVNLYLERAQIAVDYLVRVQQADGAWCNQYGYDTPGDINNPDNKEALAKSPTQTAEVMIAFHKLGYKAERYNAMKKGARYLMECQKVSNKYGRDDGLICAGKDDKGEFRRWRWVTDNSYGYQALKAAENWAMIYGEESFAIECAGAAQKIINGLDNYMYNGTVWYVAIDENGTPQDNPDLPQPYKYLPHWASYAPQMMDVPAKGVNSAVVGEWIKDSFQQANGSCVGYQYETESLKTRAYPGLSFQAALCWYDLGRNTDAENAKDWAYNISGLKYYYGGWIDWVELNPNAGLKADEWMRFIDTSFYAIAALCGGYDFNTCRTLNLDMSWYQNMPPYYSTGAASAQMIINYIRRGAVEPYTEISQNIIYEYAKGSNPRNCDLNPDEVSKALGHFDPYDALVSNWADSYDSLAAGNPHQGYNFSVETYDPNADGQAMNKYMRDICHWMAYPVTKEDWQSSAELAAHPNTPAAVPILGDYNHWVAVKGFAVSNDPAPFPHLNPWGLPDFTVYGFWLKDPLINGIGQDTYKTAAECQSSYFLPVTNINKTDAYYGKLVQVAEPPLMRSRAKVEIRDSVPDTANLKFAGLNIKTETSLTRARGLNSSSSITTKKSWQDIVDTYLLSDKEAVAAFTGTIKGSPILVNRMDTVKADYYLLPFYKRVKSKFLVSAVIVLDADKGCFKEASWTNTPQEFLKVSRSHAVFLLQRYLFNKIFNDRKLSYSRKVIKYLRIVQLLRYADARLVWQPKKYSLSVYNPYWRVIADGNTWFVTQEARVFQQ